jgi:hypothetical protein
MGKLLWWPTIPTSLRYKLSQQGLCIRQNSCKIQVLCARHKISALEGVVLSIL